MGQFKRYFTVEEANELLPELRDLLALVREGRDRMSLDLQAAAPVFRLASTNGGGKETHDYLNSLHSLNARLQQLHDLGVQLKDLDRGLVDFPAWREDREVLLCWHLGEESVQYWHELDDGFAGRKPL